MWSDASSFQFNQIEGRENTELNSSASLQLFKLVEAILCDEAHFWLNGYVNKQNCRIWSEANPQVYVETPLHPEKLTVWGALWADGIIGPYFFKNFEGHNVTLNGDRYRAMITNFFYILLKKASVGLQDLITVPHRSHRAYCKHIKVCAAIQRDACTNYQDCTIVMVYFLDNGGQRSSLEFSRDVGGRCEKRVPREFPSKLGWNRAKSHRHLYNAQNCG
ncbi:uncharacterized protein TNCV_641611 [Trichonephila clavipes]|nr:uncharacterized protein TNCV_641611 [Trichonephila clavipes]